MLQNIVACLILTISGLNGKGKTCKQLTDQAQKRKAGYIPYIVKGERYRYSQTLKQSMFVRKKRVNIKL